MLRPKFPEIIPRAKQADLSNIAPNENLLWNVLSSIIQAELTQELMRLREVQFAFAIILFYEASQLEDHQQWRLMKGNEFQDEILVPSVHYA